MTFRSYLYYHMSETMLIFCQDKEKLRSLYLDKTYIAKIIPNRDNNHVFLELFALKMIHLLSSHSFLLHFTINQVLWGTLQQNRGNFNEQELTDSLKETKYAIK